MTWRCRTTITLLTVAALCAPGSVRAQGKVNPDPRLSQEKPHEISFEVPNDGIARGEYRSEPFYAILLKTARPCSVTEPERLAVQALLPDNKVFSTRFGCDGDVEENITYTNIDPKFGFIAVFAGFTRPQAEKLLATVRAMSKFPGANIRRIEAVLVYP